MKVTFSWGSAAGNSSPCCASETVNKDGVSLICCLLTDDGGVPYLQSIPWVREGIAKIYSVLNGEVKSSSWDRDAWGARIALDEVKIVSLHDEDYFERITLQQFKHILVAWEKFIASNPNLGERKDIEL